MSLISVILSFQKSLLSKASLGVLFYYYTSKNVQYRENLNASLFEGNVESIAYSSYLNEYSPASLLKNAFKLANDKRFNKSLNIYHIIGIELQAKMQESPLFKSLLDNYFHSHSLKYKYLIQKIFPEYKEEFISSLKQYSLSNKSFEEKLLIALYISKNYQVSLILQEIKNIEHPDIPLLIILEDLSRMKAFTYEEERKKLQELVFWSASEIQSKHKIYNNNEDQFNSVFHTLLSREFRVENQSQRGETLSGKSFGELDVEVFTKGGYPLSIIEGFIISYIDKKYIGDHLVKLTKNYDPNGLKQNFAIIYTKHEDFSLFWNRYQKYVSSFKFPHQMISTGLIDISDNYPSFSNIRIGFTEHQNNENSLELYHVFINIKFE